MEAYICGHGLSFAPWAGRRMGTLWTVCPRAAARCGQRGICSRRRGEGVGAAGARGPRCFGADATRRGLAGACGTRCGCGCQEVLSPCRGEAVRWWVEEGGGTRACTGRGKGVRGGGGASGRRRHKVCGMVELYHSHQCMSFCAVARSHRRFVFVCVLCFVFIERPVGFV